jgi:hypothetical protein
VLVDHLTIAIVLGYPIWLKNNTACPIGTILVSGLPQAEDHQVRFLLVGCRYVGIRGVDTTGHGFPLLRVRIATTQLIADVLEKYLPTLE